MEGKTTRKRPAVSVTDRFINEGFRKNGVTIRVVDIPGLMAKKHDLYELKMCSAHTKGKADLLLYFLPVGAGHKFRDYDSEIMKSFTEVFGKRIWDHCVLVLTMSNMAILIFEDYDDQETAAQEYKKYLQGICTRFEEQLHDLGVEKCVKTVFELKKPDNIANTIIAVQLDTPHTIKYYQGWSTHCLTTMRRKIGYRS